MADVHNPPAPFTVDELMLVADALGEQHYGRASDHVDALCRKVAQHLLYLRAHRPPGDAATSADQLDKYAADLLSMVPSADASPFTVVGVTLESLRHVARLLQAAAVLLRTPPEEA